MKRYLILTFSLLVFALLSAVMVFWFVNTELASTAEESSTPEQSTKSV